MSEIVVVGAGALGSNFLLFARNLDAEFTLIDFDKVERKNILSQFQTKMGLNRNKAQALQQGMQGLFGCRNITAVPHRLTADNANVLLGGRRLVIDCLDNAVSRGIVQETIRKLNVPCVHGALSADGQLGRVVWDEQFKIDEEDVVGQATCDGGEHLPFIGFVSSILAQKVQLFLNDGTKSGAHIFPGGIVSL